MQLPINRRIMGVETEYAAEVHGSMRPLIERSTRRLKWCVAYNEYQRMLGNGSFIYIDSGNHPELSTPETDNPTEAVTYILAGDRIMSRAANELQSYLGKHNIDYKEHATWGAHESYMSIAPIEPALIIPHLATRIIYTGAGGLSRYYNDFCLSPRVYFLEHDSSSNTVSDRALYNTKSEPLGGEFDYITGLYDYERIHLICGEALCSETALWLKLATTALVIRLAEEIPRLEYNKKPKIPYIDLDSMRIYNSDPTLKAKANGYTALEVQYIYLDAIESHLGEDWLPVWAPEACQRWRNILEMLKEPESACRTLDWAIKYQLFNQHRSRSVKSLSHELMEIDAIFSRLSPTPGIFQELDAAGVLDHQIIDPANVQAAINTPPIGTRATLRGQLISESTLRTGLKAYWLGVVDTLNDKLVLLNDPFQTEYQWELISRDYRPGIGDLLSLCEN